MRSALTLLPPPSSRLPSPVSRLPPPSPSRRYHYRIPDTFRVISLFEQHCLEKYEAGVSTDLTESRNELEKAENGMLMVSAQYTVLSLPCRLAH
jgi:hypothetical protein